VLGYSLYLYHILLNQEDVIVHLLIAGILCGGGIFVFLVTKLSLRSYLKIENVALHAKHNALHDSLTGLPNRQNFLDQLFQNVSDGIPFTLLSIDLNNFKQVNDALGHYHGDQLLVAVVKEIEKKLINLCLLYRMGGDEFTVILEQSAGLDHEDIVQRIHQALDEPFLVKGHAIDASVSIGASNFPENSSSIDILLQQADVAMYASKAAKLPCVFYNEALNKGAAMQLDISSRLRTALATEQFELYYQPILGSDAERIHGAEVLIRWPQPDGSFIRPDVFIPIAEQSGLVGQITAWVIEKLLSDIEILDRQGFSGSLHINLSAKDLHTDALFILIKRLLAQYQFDPNRLVFEITESAMMTDLDSAKSMMLKLANEGFTFSIDDFGTGFSSLSLLRELPVSQIKIDKSFVNDMDTGQTDHAIVKSAIYLAKNLGCTVVAEGVESQMVEQALLDMSCDYFQGFLYSQPMPLAQLVQHASFQQG
jgi:diguanylate cyclase (GGDEF)-like protein